MSTILDNYPIVSSLPVRACDEVTTGSGNSDYPWAKFDPEAYFQHYYGDPHADDDCVARLATEAIKRMPQTGNDLDVIDIGTGPNLIPFLCASPRARSLTAWEFSASNIAWLEAELKRDALRPQWQHFWDVSRSAYGPDWQLPDNPMASLIAKSIVTRGSIFDLPQCRWDGATMFFCAESITGQLDEFEAAMSAFAKCVKPGGTLAAAFLVQSDGYEVGGRRFPALRLSAGQIEAVLACHAHSVKTERIGIVDEEIRSGYSGCAFVTAVAR